MAVSLADLLQTPTEAEVLAESLAYLDGLGFAAQSWQDGSWQRHLVQLFAHVFTDVAASVSAIAALGFVRTATGTAAVLNASEVYATERGKAVATQGQMVLTSSAGAPLHTVGADVVIADAATSPANTYRVLGGGGVLPPGGALTVDVEAETPGAAANIASGTTLYLWTPLVGATAANPADPGTGTWVTLLGQDEETIERLVERALGQWETLTYSVGEGAYKKWALEADSTVTRVLVRADNPLGPGTVEVICATATGTIGGPQVAAIAAYIDGVNPDGSETGRRPLNDIVTVSSAVVLGQPIEATVQVDSAFQSSTTTGAIEAAVSEYLSALPIGGKIIGGAPQGVAVRAEIVAAIMALDGVLNVDLVAPPADVTFPLYDRVLVPGYAITVSYV